ncbi:hypothetical protein MVEN_00060000 [Mycena venus]|uniref:Uncharacterized protein n=1 Tax=Mycena venus TaxID=2733690 RepID=A0A8H6Z3P1_9AGAR|nr:hypothetical protein MVEN_00060000 [Mycena venus]
MLSSTTRLFLVHAQVRSKLRNGLRPGFKVSPLKVTTPAAIPGQLPQNMSLNFNLPTWGTFASLERFNLNRVVWFATPHCSHLEVIWDSTFRRNRLQIGIALECLSLLFSTPVPWKVSADPL